MMDHPRKNVQDKKERVKAKLREKKKASKKNKHRARLVVRNLPFATTEEDLRAHFDQFGEIDEVKILKKEDNTLCGVAFVQFKLVQKAAKARHHLNGKPFLDREIECDWALPKDKYIQEKAKVEEVKIKVEGCEVKIKTEPVDDNLPIKTESEGVSDNLEKDVDVSDTENNEHINDSKIIIEDESDTDNKEEKSDSDDNNELSDSENEFEREKHFEEKKPRVVSNDATEGKTVFIKNVPFSATSDDIKRCFSQFGRLYYALVCIDPLTEHSKGTAFIKFVEKEDADSCLATTAITLMDNVLECQPAVTKGDLNNKTKDKTNRQKDSRNLYLVKEGVVLAGTKAAEGISAADMAKRLQIEQYKTQMLRNLNMFVARTRLIVHNVPPDWDDGKLRALFQKHCPKNAAVKEARIMRNMRLTDGRGVGKSKEYAFATFTTHDAALAALRAINNNPNVFTPSKRPIIAFSIENRSKLKAREKRLQNSKIKNPTYKHYDGSAVKPKEKTTPQGKKRQHESNIEPEINKFAGVAATPGSKKMRSRFNLRTQAQIHHEQLKREKRKKKTVKKTLQQKQQEFTKQPAQKVNKKKSKEDDNFSKLVTAYKTKLLNAGQATLERKKKWYEG